MNSSRPYKENVILLVDDEPEYLGWLQDYLRSQGFEIRLAVSVAEAIEAANEADYRLYLVDLNIPAGGWVPASADPSPTYNQYKGLYVIRYVRTQANAGRRVVAYSAHENDDIHAAIKNLYCQYVIKGRARDIKNEIAEALKHDPRATGAKAD